MKFDKRIKCVAFGKIGTTITFSRRNQKNPLSAIYEVTNVIEKYALDNPDVLFYLISRSDITRLKEDEYASIFPNKNVKTLLCEDFNYDFEYLKSYDVLPQVAIVYAGPSSRVNRNNYFFNTNKNEYHKTTCMFNNYAGPSYWFINELNIPWIYLGLDPRYINKNVGDCSDLYKFPFVIGNLYGRNEYIDINYNLINQDGSIRSGNVSIPTKMCYQFSYNVNLDQFDKEIDYTAKSKVLSLQNQNLSSKDDITTDRWDLTERYILNNQYFNSSNCSIIGDWSKYDKNIPDNKRDLFLGTVPPNQLNDSILKYKYSILFSMCKGMSSGKFYEMFANGVLPFLVEDYDNSHSLCSSDSFLKINSPEELVAKIKLLEENNNLYLTIIKEGRGKCREKILLHKEYFDNFINEEINKELFK